MRDTEDRNGISFANQMYELRTQRTLTYLVRAGAGKWEFSPQPPALGSGPFLERLTNGVIRKWYNQTAADMSYTDL